MSSQTNAAPNVALITGANKGIGLEIATQLGRDHGMTVLLGCRDANRGQEAEQRLRASGIDARFVQLSVTDATSIRAAADKIARDPGRLDVLVNNAGILVDRTPPSETSVQSLRDTYETNVLGPFAVTLAMLPLLRRSPAARVVNMSSGLGSLTQMADPAWGFSGIRAVAYSSSKAALNMQTILLAREFAESDATIKINAADPGYTATDLNAHRGHRTVEQGARIAVHLATLPADGPTGGYFNDDGPVPW